MRSRSEQRPSTGLMQVKTKTLSLLLINLLAAGRQGSYVHLQQTGFVYVNSKELKVSIKSACCITKNCVGRHICNEQFERSLSSSQPSASYGIYMQRGGRHNFFKTEASDIHGNQAEFILPEKNTLLPGYQNDLN